MSKKLVIGFSKNRNIQWFSNTISYFDDHANFSHVFIQMYQPEIGLDIICHASHFNVHILELSRFEQKALVTERIEIEVSDEVYNEVQKLCYLYLGCGYSWKGLIGILIAKGFKLNKNPLGDNKEDMVCSEYMAYVLEPIGIKFDKDYDLVTPSDIYKALKNLSK